MLDQFRFATATITDNYSSADVKMRVNGTGEEVRIHIAPELVPGEQVSKEDADKIATATTFIGAATDKVAFESLRRHNEKSSVNLWRDEKGVVKYASINYC